MDVVLHRSRRAGGSRNAPGIVPPSYRRPGCSPALPYPPARRDRKSTRLNSSHVKISYAVFCLKKKKNLHPLVLLPIINTNDYTVVPENFSNRLSIFIACMIVLTSGIYFKNIFFFF